jgi:hypothetical protein
MGRVAFEVGQVYWSKFSKSFLTITAVNGITIDWSRECTAATPVDKKDQARGFEFLDTAIAFVLNNQWERRLVNMNECEIGMTLQNTSVAWTIPVIVQQFNVDEVTIHYVAERDLALHAVNEIKEQLAKKNIAILHRDMPKFWEGLCSSSP